MNERTRVIGVGVVVMALAAGALKALDRVPALLAGTAHGARVFASIEEAERAVGARIWLPAYYPDELAWPPASIEVSATEPPTVLVRLAGRDGGRDRLVVAQSIGWETPPPAGFLPPAQELGSADIALGGHRARLSRVLLGPHEMHDLRWDQDRRRVTLRYRGPVDTLMLVAASLERRAGGAR